MASCFPGPSRIDLSQHAQPLGRRGLIEDPAGYNDNELRARISSIGFLKIFLALLVFCLVVLEIRNRATYAVGRSGGSCSGATGTAHAESVEGQKLVKERIRMHVVATGRSRRQMNWMRVSDMSIAIGSHSPESCLGTQCSARDLRENCADLDQPY